MRILKTTAALAVAALAVACGGGSSDDGGKGSAATELKLGYFPNITHASAVYGVASGVYQAELGATKLKAQTFNAGPAAVEALFAGSIDATYLGPGPAVNAFIKSKGAVVLVAGATSGGAALVVRPGVTELKGKKIADPQTGGTQDIALRAYLESKSLKVDKQGAGDVSIQPQENAQTLDLFKAGKLDGAWVPEPWASRLVLDGGGTVLVDEKTLWPGGKFVTTNLLVRKKFLEEHPDAVKALIKGQLKANEEITADPAKAKTVINGALKTLTGKSLKPAVIDRAFEQIELTVDPIASSLKTGADHAFATGLVKQGELKGIYDLSLLEDVTGKTYDDAGLGKG
ncbi:MAG TPA: ABC transporter substrate-binding protein [Mycobacteriales bacterium]|nr:ABC transporter substrate-binding protein [Mycobacteriales bacterium]